MSDNVKVAVRVRPLNSREINMDASIIVDMDGPVTKITNPKTGEEKPFTFDYSFWSIDAEDPKYASQQTVFNALGVEYLDNAWKGFNVSLFAYGQTGAGKSYSMTGYGKDKGIIPMGCEELFARIEGAEPVEGTSYRVEVSFLEIYNESIKDLFNPATKASALKIRQHKTRGIYVDGLARLPVANYDDIERLMDMGSKARTVAATAMNATSSRSHSVFTVYFTQTKVDEATMSASDTVSKINLVDLAGSERQKSTGATGDRLKEGCAINKSLSALGNVISCLAKAAKVIPYRDSTLTRLLQESLGGNAKTIMIAAISPANVNYDESMSTLKYADRAKQIVNRAVVNESPNDKLIRELREEVARLRAMMANGGIDPNAAAAVAAPSSGNDEVEALRRQLEEREKEMAEMGKTWEQRLAETGEVMRNQEQSLAMVGVGGDIDPDTPHFVNLNEDPMLAGTLYYYFAKDETRFGKADASTPQDVQLVGLSIASEHVIIRNTYDGSLTIEPQGNAPVYQNGTKITTPAKLGHNDRVVLGNNHFFRYVYPPAQTPEEREDPTKAPDYEMAKREMLAAQMGSLTAGIGSNAADMSLDAVAKHLEEMKASSADAQAKLAAQEAQLKEQQAALEAERAAAESRIKEEADAARKAVLEEEAAKLAKQMEEEKAAAQAEFERRAAELEAANAKMAEALKKQQNESELYQKRKKKELEESMLLEEQLLKTVPLVNEANAISREMQKGMRFEMRLLSHISASDRVRSTEVAIQATDAELGMDSTWSYEKFSNRIFLMRELYQTYMENNGEDFFITQEEDPFWDPPEDQLVGKARVYLEPLLMGVDFDLTTSITDFGGKTVGELMIKIEPVTPDGAELEDDDDWCEPGTRVDFKLSIISARGLPTDLSIGPFARFTWYLDEEPTMTPRCDKRTINPVWDFSTQITVLSVTEELRSYLEHDALEFEVWGHTDEVDDEGGFEADDMGSTLEPGARPSSRGSSRSMSSRTSRVSAVGRNNRRRQSVGGPNATKAVLNATAGSAAQSIFTIAEEAEHGTHEVSVSVPAVERPKSSDSTRATHGNNPVTPKAAAAPKPAADKPAPAPADKPAAPMSEKDKEIEALKKQLEEMKGTGKAAAAATAPAAAKKKSKACALM